MISGELNESQPIISIGIRLLQCASRVQELDVVRKIPYVISEFVAVFIIVDLDRMALGSDSIMA